MRIDRFQQNYDNKSPPEPTDFELKQQEQDEKRILFADRYERIIRYNAIEFGESIEIVGMLAELLKEIVEGNMESKFNDITDTLVCEYIHRPFNRRHDAINQLFDAAIEYEAKKRSLEEYPVLTI